MGETLTYADALKILGHRRSRLTTALDAAASMGLMAWAGAAWASGADAGVPLNLFELKNDVVRFAHRITTRTAEWRSGLSRFDRTQRLAAAHTVLVISAYFEALEQADLPVALDRFALTRSEQAAQATAGRLPQGYVELVELLITDQMPLPECHRSYDQVRRDVGRVHARLAERLGLFARGLAVWDELDDRQRRCTLDALTSQATLRQALKLYDNAYRRLAVDNYEFAVWAALAQTQALGAGLAQVTDLLQSSTQRPGNRARVHLLKANQAVLDEPVISSAQAAEGVVLPPLREAYVNPSCRVAEVNPTDAPADHEWWQGQKHVPDVEGVLAGYLTSPRATQTPLVVLGEPGSGKSKLTEVLAARLADTDFLPVRVELRAVPAESMIQEQIEHAIYRGPGERISWPDLVEAAGDALPVVILDGFDELLQASGVNRYDYLEQVRDFQRTQARIGHPVAVIVTSRTLVADRARFPIGTLAVRLEPFGHKQVRRWLEVWRRYNADVLARRSLRPLPAEVALAHPELAEQPLLLTMLALFDATSNALQHDGATLSRSELYEALLMDFALREVRKIPRNQSLATARQQELAERELHRLAIVALAMFARRRQSVSAAELDHDLPTLFSDGEAPDHPDTALTAAQRAVGRFFFLHTSEASRRGRIAHSYEFLHATFGEFLVAWLTARALRDLAAVREVLRRGVTGTHEHLDDGFLYAILSFACLAERRPTVDFLVELLRRIPDWERSNIRQLLAHLLAGALHPPRSRSYGDYEPVRLPIPQRLAAYSANLTVLGVLLADTEIDAGEMFGADAVESWRRYASLWHGQFAKAEWDGLVDVVRARIWRDSDRLTIRLSRETGGPAALRDVLTLLSPTDIARRSDYDILVSDPDALSLELSVPPAVTSGHLIRELAYLPNWRVGLLLLQSTPLLHAAADALRWRTSDDRWMLPGLVLAQLDYGRTSAPERRAALYRHGFEALADNPQLREQLLRRLVDDIPALPPAAVLDMLRQLGPTASGPAYLSTINALWHHLSSSAAKHDLGARHMLIALVTAIQRAAPNADLSGISPDLLSAARTKGIRAA